MRSYNRIIRLNYELFTRVQTVARNSGCSLAAVVRSAIEDRLEDVGWTETEEHLRLASGPFECEVGWRLPMKAYDALKRASYPQPMTRYVRLAVARYLPHPVASLDNGADDA